MSQKVSMADIARRLGMSRATVSYALNESTNELVADATRERVLAMAREMGYRPNLAAQALKGRASYLIEMFVHGYYPAYHARALYVFEQQVGPTPYQLYIVHPSRWSGDEWNRADSGWPSDGVIIFDEALPDAAIAMLKERHKPIVALGTNPPADVDQVRIDVYPALLKAMRHLAARGGRVAFLSAWEVGKPETIHGLRYEAYRAVMKEANLVEELILTPYAFGLEKRRGTYEFVKNYVAQHGCPNAIFCHNDERAIATLAALRDLNYRVPQDVLIIGHDGIEDTAYQSPPLSTIEYPIEEGARLAWQFLQHRIAHPNAPLQSATLTAPLVLRESSAR